MLYHVTAQILEERMAGFYKKLTDGTIGQQKPDGSEIVSSMRRAKMTSAGRIEWLETCYCSTPLAHEKETVYNDYLTGVQARKTTPGEKITGDSFWAYLQRLTDRSGQ